MISVVILVSFVTLISASSEPQREVVLFDRADKNHDGQLTRAELDAVFLQFDINHDHSVTQAEFDTDWVTIYALGNHKEASVLFTKADVNDDGVIDHNDLPGIFSFFDIDADGHVSVNEFLTQWGQLKLLAVDTIIINIDNTTTTTDHGLHTTTN